MARPSSENATQESSTITGNLLPEAKIPRHVLSNRADVEAMPQVVPTTITNY